MTSDSLLVLDRVYDVRSYEPRQDGRVPVTAVCNQLQDIASRHADGLGFGYHDLETSGHYWLLARLHVMMERMPGYGDSVRVRTWPSGNERLVATRDFLILDPNGEDAGPGAVLGRATSAWVTMNARTHRPDPPHEVLHARFIPEVERALAFPTRAVTRLSSGEHEQTLAARRADLDINGHVNNVRYAEFCLEAVPQAWEETRFCTGLDIQFRSESFVGDAYVSVCAEADPDNGTPTLLHRLTRIADDREIVRMRSWWRPRNA
ncbi:acyl-ACP thioesterase [Pseudodesulfovibrio sp. F-1]|uniref:Acyl-ACP thioesterase n=1 Tax=Pseudodesulfovibrio alkaliphilus TaxID=2661613 RepID=A0A7K1KRQ2_9BACT|nr:acyl-ACP thioesterase domain-containing protein [Pseudodesulfovibrio alkaliphilus]MUM78779.1 acyl-ACP thioesterase [Pseudodesulfovibrio alkaliphilus]